MRYGQGKRTLRWTEHWLSFWAPRVVPPVVRTPQRADGGLNTFISDLGDGRGHIPSPANLLKRQDGEERSPVTLMNLNRLDKRTESREEWTYGDLNNIYKYQMREKKENSQIFTVVSSELRRGNKHELKNWKIYLLIKWKEKNPNKN